MSERDRKKKAFAQSAYHRVLFFSVSAMSCAVAIQLIAVAAMMHKKGGGLSYYGINGLFAFVFLAFAFYFFHYHFAVLGIDEEYVSFRRPLSPQKMIAISSITRFETQPTRYGTRLTLEGTYEGLDILFSSRKAASMLADLIASAFKERFQSEAAYFAEHGLEIERSFGKKRLLVTRDGVKNCVTGERFDWHSATIRRKDGSRFSRYTVTAGTTISVTYDKWDFKFGEQLFLDGLPVLHHADAASGKKMQGGVPKKLPGLLD